MSRTADVSSQSKGQLWHEDERGVGEGSRKEGNCRKELEGEGWSKGEFGKKYTSFQVFPIKVALRSGHARGGEIYPRPGQQTTSHPPRITASPLLEIWYQPPPTLANAFSPPQWSKTSVERYVLYGLTGCTISQQGTLSVTAAYLCCSFPFWVRPVLLGHISMS